MSALLILIIGVAVVVGLAFMVILGVIIAFLMNRRKTYSDDETPVEDKTAE